MERAVLVKAPPFLATIVKLIYLHMSLLLMLILLPCWLLQALDEGGKIKYTNYYYLMKTCRL